LAGARVFFGGLGQVTGGLSFAPDFHGILNRHPFPDVVHGCLLEGMALALEGRFEPFSHGRGFITRERVEEMEIIASRHGIGLAPLYNADGPVEDAPTVASAPRRRVVGATAGRLSRDYRPEYSVSTEGTGPYGGQRA
jgi:hypothetical protein